MTTLSRTGAGTIWDRYNVIAAAGRLARRTLGIRARGVALGVFFVFGNFTLLFLALWVMMDLLSTWEWTSFLTPQVEGGTDFLSGNLGSIAAAAVALRIVLQCMSLLPSLFELSAPYFADQDDLFAGLFIIFSCFDIYTDWPKAAALAAGVSYEGWGVLAGLAQWGLTVALSLFFSFAVQYLMVLFAVIAGCAAWRAVWGPARQARRGDDD